MKHLLLALFAVISLAFSGCSGVPVKSSDVSNFGPLIATAASVTTTEALARVKDVAKRKQDANYVYSVAVGMRTLSGTTPTAEQVAATLQSFGAPDDPQLSALVTSLSQLYMAYFDKFSSSNDGVKSAAVILENLAEGAEAGAAAYK